MNCEGEKKYHHASCFVRFAIGWLRQGQRTASLHALSQLMLPFAGLFCTDSTEAGARGRGLRPGRWRELRQR